MSRIICFAVLCVLCVEVAVSEEVTRVRRAGGASSSSSSSSSGSYSSGGGGAGGAGGGFAFPTNNFGFSPFGNFGGPPFPDFNILFQQFLANLQAAQAYAAQNPHYAPIFKQQLASLMAQQQAAMAQFPTLFSGIDSNTITPDIRTGGSPGGGAGGAGGVYTGASVNYGSQGGYGQAASYPGGADGLGVRIAEELPPPSGGSFGVFTSSSSGTSDVNGKRTSFKTSTFGTNDNGKITFRTVNE